MNADPNKNNRRRTVKTRSRFTTLLTVYFFVALIIPNCVLANTEPYSVWTVEALILMPLGFYMMWSVALRRSGIMIWLAFPFIFLCAFQIVLLYLFGNSIIATDMFTNLVTTNPGEAGELLSNIYPSVILVCVMYLPLLWFKVIPNSFEVTDLSTLLLAALQWTAFGSLLGYLGERRFAKPRASK